MACVLRVSRLAAFLALVSIAFALAGGHPFAQSQRATELLDRYARGDFDAVVDGLTTRKDFDQLLKQLTADGPAWIAAGGVDARERRELVAATFALEAARADEWHEWKVRQKPLSREMEQEYLKNHLRLPERVLYWQPPPLFIEWGRKLFAGDAKPRPIERYWQLAAVAVAERAEDAEFLTGIHKRDESDSGEISYLRQARERFPNEARFKIAGPIAFDWLTWPLQRDASKPDPNQSSKYGAATIAEREFAALQNDRDVGAEAHLRLGALHLRRSNEDAALRDFEQVESSTRDPYLVYLARYFAGQALEQKKRPEDAMRAYRRALLTIPGAESASFALSALLFKSDATSRRAEAYGVVATALSGDPLPLDPWRAYGDADDRFWPQLIAHLRAEIQR